MSRMQRLKQRAARRGLYVVRALTNCKRWDIIDSCGPQGLEVTKREAILRASQAASRPPKCRVYLTGPDGQWHRGRCEVVASPYGEKPHPCDCQYLVV